MTADTNQTHKGECAATLNKFLSCINYIWKINELIKKNYLSGIYSFLKLDVNPPSVVVHTIDLLWKENV